MWYNNVKVMRTHCKNGTQMAWALISGIPGISGWLSIKPNSADGVTNVFLVLCAALANNRSVDVLIESGQVTQATLR